MPASIRRRRSPISTHGAAPMLRPFTTPRSPRLPPRSLCMTRNQYMPWPCAHRSLAPCQRGSADEIDRAVAQRRVALVDGVDELERDIEAFLLEAIKLDRGDRGEIRVRDHVGHGEFHVSNSSLLCGVTMHLAALHRASRAQPAYSWRRRCAVRLPGACRVRNTRFSPPSRLGAQAPAANGRDRSRATAAAA